MRGKQRKKNALAVKALDRIEKAIEALECCQDRLTVDEYKTLRKRIGHLMDTLYEVGEALSKFMLVVENYPDLKANQNFLALQEELTSTENKISFSRQNYNDQVLFFNNKIQMFPSNVVANVFRFTKRDFFEIENVAEREVPKVKFS